MKKIESVNKEKDKKSEIDELEKNEKIILLIERFILCKNNIMISNKEKEKVKTFYSTRYINIIYNFMNKSEDINIVKRY